MARTNVSKVLIILFISCILLLIIHESDGRSFHEFQRRNDPLADRYLNLWSYLRRRRRDPLSSSDEVLRSSTRSVIPPRICYLARILGSTGQQKICLPYNDR